VLPLLCSASPPRRSQWRLAQPIARPRRHKAVPQPAKAVEPRALPRPRATRSPGMRA